MDGKDTSNVHFTVGKIDAGMTILLTSDYYLIEFPSSLLPRNIKTGSILNISISCNYDAEVEEKKHFEDLQTKIYTAFGTKKPSAPVLRVKNVTQTSVVLEWNPIELATTELRSLVLYKNGSRFGKIPKAISTTSTKISGLTLNTEYSFQLVLKTSGGIYSSNSITVHTHKITDLSGITVCAGELDENEKNELKQIIEKIGAKPIQSEVEIDTTHFVTSKTSGHEYKKAISMNIPIVTLDYIRSCDLEKKLVSVRKYYFDTNIFQEQLIDNPKSNEDFQVEDVKKTEKRQNSNKMILKFNDSKINSFTKTLDETGKSPTKELSAEETIEEKNEYDSSEELASKKVTSNEEKMPLETTVQSSDISTNENVES